MATHTAAEWARICRTHAWIARDEKTKALFIELAAEFDRIAENEGPAARSTPVPPLDGVPDPAD